jgi:hypothetical protein
MDGHKISGGFTCTSIMGNNEGSVEATLGQRGSIYGSYDNVIATRASIMDLLKAHHKKTYGDDMSDKMGVALGDIVLKLVRGVGAPEYADSWHDLAGYATLMEELAKKATSGGYSL